MRYQTKLRLSATDAEQQFYYLTRDLGLNIVFQKYYKRRNGGVYFPDFQFSLNNNQFRYLRKMGLNRKRRIIRHRILVEIDGGYHDQQKAYDYQRQREIENRQGKTKYHIIRFTNHEVLYNTASVLDRFKAYCKEIWGCDLNMVGITTGLLRNQNSPIKEYDFTTHLYKPVEGLLYTQPKELKPFVTKKNVA
jgi:hypothetical protein